MSCLLRPLVGNVRVKNACEMDQLDLNTIWPLSARSRHRTNDAISGLYRVNDLYAGRAKRDLLTVVFAIAITALNFLFAWPPWSLLFLPWQ